LQKACARSVDSEAFDHFLAQLLRDIRESCVAKLRDEASCRLQETAPEFVEQSPRRGSLSSHHPSFPDGQ
jgi:hypothetical protein